MNVLPHAMALREHPHRHHRREVERRDAGHDAERLADLVDVDAARDLLAEAALEQVRDAARELEVLEAAGDLAERVRRDLAVLGGQERGDAPCRCVSTRFRIRNMISVRFESDVARQAGKAAFAAATAASTSSTEAKSTSRAIAPGGRVVDRAFAPGRAGDDAAADPVADPARCRASSAAGCRVLRPVSSGSDLCVGTTHDTRSSQAGGVRVAPVRTARASPDPARRRRPIRSTAPVRTRARHGSDGP